MALPFIVAGLVGLAAIGIAKKVLGNDEQSYENSSSSHDSYDKAQRDATLKHERQKKYKQQFIENMQNQGITITTNKKNDFVFKSSKMIDGLEEQAMQHEAHLRQLVTLEDILQEINIKLGFKERENLTLEQILQGDNTMKNEITHNDKSKEK